MNRFVYFVKQFIRSLTPIAALEAYYWSIAQLAAWWYRYPSGLLIVIGVTGTNGKSTTVNLIGRILEYAGYRVGWMSTANFKVAEVEWLNDTKMTMLGRFALQRLLAQMVQHKCDIAVVETSSEGLVQHRHVGIDYDIAVFTNLTPEHLESHGGFERYRDAKRLLFASLERSQPKRIHGKAIPKTIIVNLDDDHASSYSESWAEEKVGYCVVEGNNSATPVLPGITREVSAHLIRYARDHSQFDIDGCPITVHLPGRFNVYNAVAAIAAAGCLNVPIATAAKALDRVLGVPGRLEWIQENQPFQVLIDYAPEPESLRQLYSFLETVEYQRLIHVLGSTGGGRDRSRRAVLGKMAAQRADIMIVTNEDPYDDDPQTIIDDIARGAREVANPRMKELLTIPDRREAICMAFARAQKDDLILITGKGCEQAMCVAHGKKIPWDDRAVAREELQALLAQ